VTAGAGHRPVLLVAVVGTDTEVGKTWVSCRLADALASQGRVVAARKPALSHSPDDATTDADELARVTGARPDQICPPRRWYPVPMAPPMAAAALDRPPFRLADLLDELRWPPGVDVGLVEGAGGTRSPLADDGDNADLVRALGPDEVIVVADAGLGTINAVRGAVDALAPRSPLVFLNRFVDQGADGAVHRANRRWLEDRDHLTTFHDIWHLARHLREPGTDQPR
jgi:dethiobiotin synthetase